MTKPWIHQADLRQQQHSAAAERNGPPILAMLKTFLPPSGRALEIASGTGQHVALFAAAMPGWVWQPTDAGPVGFGSIAHWCHQAGAVNVMEPLEVDVLSEAWVDSAAACAGPWDAIYCANMLHISPWATSSALMRGAALRMSEGGRLVIYGPFLQAGVVTAPGNLEFDQSLRQRDPAWGLRSLDDVVAQAALAGLHLIQRTNMPANNLLLSFSRK